MDDFADFLVAIAISVAVVLWVTFLFMLAFDEESPCKGFGEEYRVATVYENGECFVEENGQRFILEQYKYNKLNGTVPTPSVSVSPAVIPSN